MSALSITASRGAALMLATISVLVPLRSAGAADLGDGGYSERPAAYGERYRDEGPPPRSDRYADVPDDFEPPYPPQRRAGRESECIPRELARDRLQDAGWYDFHGLEAREDLVYVKARRPSGRLFDLTIDRCSGQIVDARPIFGGRRDDYAWGGPALGIGIGLGPRRHWAPY